MQIYSNSTWAQISHVSMVCIIHSPSQLFEKLYPNLLEEGMATHSGTRAWRIPWTEEPGGLYSIGGKESDMAEVSEHAHPHTS